MTNSDPLVVVRDGHIETWTLNDPDRRNPISEPAVIEALVDNVSRVNSDLVTRAVILTGAGSAFSAGGNVKDMVAGTGMFGGSPYSIRNSYRDGIQRIPLALYHCEVPVVAAVNGPAIGAGCDLAMMCDLRIASTSAFFAESFVKLGIIPGDGGAWLLTRAIGPARAAEMALTGDRVSAQQAAEWGMVNSIAEPGQLMDAARELAERVSSNPPHSLRMAKKLLRESQHQSLASLLELSAAMQALAHHTDDHAEAVSAFVDKRMPRFTGS